MYIPDACNGTGTTLAGGEGHIWINAPLYQDSMHCQWKIKVKLGYVSITYSRIIILIK